MATIALYANKVNQLPDLIKDVKKSVSNYKEELSNVKKKTLTVNKNVCDLEEVVRSIQSSTLTQEDKIDVLDKFYEESEQFISSTVSTDGDVADVINKGKDDFYEKYYYLKPECEKSIWEKFSDGCKKVGDWCKEHWKLIVTAIIVIAAVILVVCFPAAATILLLAAKGAIAGAISGGIIGGALSALTGGSFLEGFENGAFSGAISGAIFGGLGGAGKMFAGSCNIVNKLGGISKVAKAITTTFKVSTGITATMGGFDLLSLAIGYFDPDNPLVVLNQKLHKSALYNGFQFLAEATAAFSGGAYLRMKQGPPACFVAGTTILTAMGLVTIENIKVGDTVIATNPETFTTVERTVVETYIREVPHLVHLTIHKEEIITTIDHPFYIKERGFVKASELQVGDEVLNVTGDSHTVERALLEVVEKPETVYNFQVEEFHTYYVGNCKVLVHNAEYPRASGVTRNIFMDDLTEDLLQTKPKNSPNPQKWLDNNGTISVDKDGVWSYTNSKGQSVKYTDGYPDFKNAGLVKQEVDIGGFKDYTTDFKRADSLAPNGPRDAVNNTWHHSQDKFTLQEVDKVVHKEFTHRGGMSLKKTK